MLVVHKQTFVVETFLRACLSFLLLVFLAESPSAAGNCRYDSSLGWFIYVLIITFECPRFGEMIAVKALLNG